MGAGNKLLTIHIHISSGFDTFQFGILWGTITSLLHKINPRDNMFSSSLLTHTQLSWLLKFALAAGIKSQAASNLLSGVGVFKPAPHHDSQEQMSFHNSLKTPSTNIIFPVTYSGLSDWNLFL